MEAAGLVSPSEQAGAQRDSVAANSLNYNGRAVAVAANDRALTFDDWEQITPWGDFPNPQGLQRLNKKTGQQMVDAFNRSRMAGNSIGVPIFHGHPDVSPSQYLDDRRYGKITALEARSDGLWGKPAWNSLGEENKREGFLVFPSGVWKFKRMPGGVIEPFELVSVGLTNSPIIPTVKAWTANSTTAEDLDRNPAIRAAQLLYRQTLGSAQNSSDKATMPGAANGIGDQVKESALAYQQKHKCDWATAWNAQKKDARFEGYFRGSVGANSDDAATMRAARRLHQEAHHPEDVKPPTPADIKRQTKQAQKEHAVMQDGYSAAQALINREKYLREEKGMGEHEATLQAKLDLPESAAAHAKSALTLSAAMKAKERQNNLQKFAKDVQERMNRENCSYAQAWHAQKKANKADPDDQKWSPDDE
jgi:hypothetical protein